MIPEFVEGWERGKARIRKGYERERPEEWKDLFDCLVRALAEEADTPWGYGPDPGRTYVIDDGDYQGTFVFLVADSSYQPERYWYVRVEYGSCSGCDALQSALFDHPDGSVEQIDELMTLTLHLLQGLKELS